jgi:23S rRNA pseudouridine955/2504/2580 synthase/23S rRNA pseudouridine1911/1915/1917 synthase
MTEPDRNNYPNLKQEILNYLKTTTGISKPYAQHLHRLDRPVSGLVLFARDRNCLHKLSNQFAERKVDKHYFALTTIRPEKSYDTLEHWHRKEKKKGHIVPQGTEHSVMVRLDYQIQNTAKPFLWDIQLHTGKFHQIRCQLAHINCPIVGDEFYGSNISFKENAIALQAYKLVFTHPVSGERIKIEVECNLKN